MVDGQRLGCRVFVPPSAEMQADFRLRSGAACDGRELFQRRLLANAARRWVTVISSINLLDAKNWSPQI